MEPTYTESELNDAIDDVILSMLVREASILWGVLRTTLYSCVYSAFY